MVTSGGGRLATADAERRLRGPAADLSAITLASGEEAWLRDRLVAAFRAGALAEGAEFRRLEGDTLDAAELEGALQALPLFGVGVRIWIRECAKLARAPADSLLAWTRGSGEGVRVLATTARETSELKLLESLAERATVVSCAPRPEERPRWGERMAAEAGLSLPPGLAGAIAAAAPDLLALEQEIGKLSALADAAGHVSAQAAGVLRGGQGSASLERWVDAVLAPDLAAARTESAALAGSGPGGAAALWAVAERALGALEPGGGWPRRPAASGLTPAAARRVLDAVYRADRAVKRGELRDEDVMEELAPAVAGAVDAARKETIGP